MKYIYGFFMALCWIFICIVQVQAAGRFVPHVLEAPQRQPMTDHSAIAGMTVPKHCHGMPQHLLGYCNMAMQFQITIPEAMNVFTIVDVEHTANLCKFKLTDDFEMTKNNILISEQREQAYLSLLNSDIVNYRINNKRVWCLQAYKNFGPKAKPQPPTGIVFKWYK